MSDAILGAEQEFTVGSPTVVESTTPDGRFGVVFEDDGDTGFFYARNFTVDADDVSLGVHIYTVEAVSDRTIPCHLHILWSPDFEKACLLINRYPHAVLDIANRHGYSRDVFPDPSPESGWMHHPWDDSLRRYFFP